ncbi:S-layer homology domain-containing protein [Alkaliphilus sp. B6464]|uniref:S-layer homology domain-containing protein n=1 Tax=Alkaliphilus sp. B6464 TaxID=2731219 RepID=UPI001BA701B5|nr:S-layer homology domain-containing protein [Alkaliphilus sp. B6464]QUH19193.1 S-layer homology domain-containing protein [Alkaliphilus sp. B6464]
MKKVKEITLVALILILMLSGFVNAQQPQKMTRVNFVKELIKLMNVEIDQGSEPPFKDITKKEDIPYLAAAFNKKIISGDRGKFNAEEFVTKEQAVVMLVRALGVLNINQDEASKAEINFLDANKISDWARPYVTYAVKYGLIDDSQGKFEPQKVVTKPEIVEMLNKFKEAFVREGLTAAQILELADNKLKGYDTYKFKGSIGMTQNVKLPTGEEELTVTKIEQDGIFEAPGTVYTISKNTTNIEGQLIEEVSEVYMKDRVMYIHIGQNQGWIKVDLNTMIMQVGSITGIRNTQEGLPQFSKEQLEAVGMYARYGHDVEIDGEKYYVIKVDLDSRAFMEMYNKAMDETFKYMFEGEMWEETRKTQGFPEGMEEETFKAIVRSTAEQVLKNTDIKMMQEYYIHRENKHYSKLIVKQLININFMEVETKVNIDGQYKYYGFGENVVFPEIS